MFDYKSIAGWSICVVSDFEQWMYQKRTVPGDWFALFIYKAIRCRKFPL